MQFFLRRIAALALTGFLLSTPAQSKEAVQRSAQGLQKRFEARKQKKQENATEKINAQAAGVLREDFYGVREWLPEANLFSDKPASEERGIDVSDFFTEAQIKILSEVGEIHQQLQVQRARYIHDFGQQFAPYEAENVAKTLAALRTDRQANEKFCDFWGQEAQHEIERLEISEKLIREDFAQFTTVVGNAHLADLIKRAKQDSIYTEAGRGKLNIVDGKFVTRIVHNDSRLAFLIGDLDPESEHVKQYMARLNWDTKVPTATQPHGDAELQGLDAVLVVVKEDFTQFIAQPKPTSVFTRSWWQKWVAATHRPVTKSNYIFGAISGTMGAGIVLGMSGLFGQDMPWIPALVTAVYSGGMSIWQQTYFNWKTRGTTNVRNLKQSGISNSFAYLLNIATNQGIQGLVTIHDPSGNFTLSMTHDQAFTHIGILMNSVLNGYVRAAWDKWSIFRQQHRLDAHPVHIEIKIPNSDKILFTIHSNKIQQSAVHRQLVVANIPTAGKMIDLMHLVHASIEGIPVPVGKSIMLGLIPLADLAIWKNGEAQLKLPQNSDSVSLKRDTEAARLRWMKYAQPFLDYGVNPARRFVIDPVIKTLDAFVAQPLKKLFGDSSEGCSAGDCQIMIDDIQVVKPTPDDDEIPAEIETEEQLAAWHKARDEAHLRDEEARLHEEEIRRRAYVLHSQCELILNGRL